MSAAPLVVVRGGGDLGTGVAHRLVGAGCRVVVLESERPRAVRRRVAFAEAVFTGRTVVEGVAAVRVSRDELTSKGDEREDDPPHGLRSADGPGVRPEVRVPVAVDPDGESIARLHPDVVVDARMAKRNLGTRIDDAPLTVALGPGFEAGRDVDVVIETMRGESLGAVIERGTALADTGVPGRVGGATSERLLRSPARGWFFARCSIGDLVGSGEEVGRVAPTPTPSGDRQSAAPPAASESGAEGGTPVLARLGGVVRGLLADGLEVGVGDKIGDVDPRGRNVDPSAISDKARAIGDAVLRAMVSRGLLPGD